jgi:hypothetical protein
MRLWARVWLAAQRFATKTDKKEVALTILWTFCCRHTILDIGSGTAQGNFGGVSPPDGYFVVIL